MWLLTPTWSFRPSRKRLQPALALLLLFLEGSSYSLAVFSVDVEKAAPVPKKMENVWSSSMALMGLVAIPVMIFAGGALAQGRQVEPFQKLPFGKSKTDRVRIFSFVSSAVVYSMVFVTPAVVRGLPWVVRTVIAMQGIPVNLYFLLCSEMLAAWLPEHAGLAVGAGQMAFSFGTLFFNEVCVALMEKVGVLNAVNICYGGIATLLFLISGFLEWPPAVMFSEDAEVQTEMDEQKAVIPFQQLATKLSFWSYVFSILTTQLGFVFIAYYFKIGILFGRPLHAVVKSYNIIFLLATLSVPLIGSLADMPKRTGGMFGMDSKRVTAYILLFQAVAFLSMVPISNGTAYIGFVLMSGVLLTTLCAGIGIAPVLARDMFTATNSSVVFGAGGTIAFGMGSYLSSAVMAMMTSVSSQPKTPSLYNPFYVVAFVWSLCGFGAAIWITRHDNGLGEFGSRHLAEDGQNDGQEEASLNVMIARKMSEEQHSNVHYGSVR